MSRGHAKGPPKEGHGIHCRRSKEFEPIPFRKATVRDGPTLSALVILLSHFPQCMSTPNSLVTSTLPSSSGAEDIFSL